MWVVDISSDMIRLFVEGNVETFARNGVESVFGPRLVSIYRQSPTDQILVINGPGGFTNLRVGALALSLLNALTGAKIQFYSTTKINLYKYAVDHSDFPSQWAIYLGQKHNVWWYDFTQMISTQVRLESLPVEEDASYFLDFVSDKSYWWIHGDMMITIWIEETWLSLLFTGQKSIVPFVELLKVASPVVLPEYFVSAI